jgi:serine/threonine protein kinase
VKSHSSSEIILIDFGFAKEFLSDYGKHCERSLVSEFAGNFLYQSPNAFNFKTLSRRDDMISLANILAFYFIGEVPWSNYITSKEDLFNQVKQIKLKQTPESICSGEAALMLPFVKEVYSYKFKDEPHYGKLK